jgi:hypothetical protein
MSFEENEYSLEYAQRTALNQREPWRFAVTFFPDDKAKTKTEEKLNAFELIERIETSSAPTKKLLPWMKLATYGGKRTEHGCLRNDDNVDLLSGVLVDYDGEAVSLDEAAALIYDARLDAIIYSSPSCTIARPRYRVICPFSSLLLPLAHSRMVGRLNGVLGGILAPESWGLSQSYYYGHARDNVNADFRVIHVMGGTIIDNRSDLDGAAVGKPGSGRGVSSGGGGPRKPAGWWRELAAGEIGDKYRTEALCSFAGLLLSRGYSDDDYVNLLLQFNREKLKPNLTEKKVRHTAHGIWRTHQRRTRAVQ